MITNLIGIMWDREHLIPLNDYYCEDFVTDLRNLFLSKKNKQSVISKKHSRVELQNLETILSENRYKGRKKSTIFAFFFFF